MQIEGLIPCSYSVQSVQLLNRVQLSATPWTIACQASLSITNSQSLPNSCPSSGWCHPTILSFVVPFSSCPQSFPASRSFQMSQLFAWSGQSIGVSASTSVLPMNTQDWSPLGWTSWTSLQSKGLSRVFSNTTVQKHQFFSAQLSLQSNSYIHTYYILSNVRGQLLYPLWIFFLSSKTPPPPPPPPKNLFFFTGSFPPDINIFIKQKQNTPKQKNKQFQLTPPPALQRVDWAHCFQFCPFIVSWSQSSATFTLIVLKKQFLSKAICDPHDAKPMVNSWLFIGWPSSNIWHRKIITSFCFSKLFIYTNFLLPPN